MTIENKKVKEKARELGARFVGIGSADRWKEAPQTVRPEAVLPKAKSVIVIGVPIPRGMVETIPSHLWSREHGHLMGSKVDEITDELANWLEDQRFKSTPVGGLAMAKDVHKKFTKVLGDVPYPIYSDFPEAGLALNWSGWRAGLGTMGKSGNLLIEEFGPNVILGGVITTADIEPDPMLDYEICNNCDKCVEGCPGGAISKDGTPGMPVFDAARCFLTNAAEGRTLKAALDRGDKNVSDYLMKTIFMQSESTPATCVCGKGCLADCPIDSRARKLK
jgi:epoxyqueuosine reductase QueG